MASNRQHLLKNDTLVDSAGFAKARHEHALVRLDRRDRDSAVQQSDADRVSSAKSIVLACESEVVVRKRDRQHHVGGVDR